MQLWEDLERVKEANGNRYLGVILVAPSHAPLIKNSASLPEVGVDGAGDVVQVVDGQQRLTTLTLLAAALVRRAHAPGNSKSAHAAKRWENLYKNGDGNFQFTSIMHLPNNEPTYQAMLDILESTEKTCKTKTIVNPSIPDYGKIGTTHKAIDNLVQKISHDEASDYLDCLLDRIVIVEVKVSDPQMAYEMYLSQNYGVELSAGEVFVALVTALAYKDQINSQVISDRTKYAEELVAAAIKNDSNLENDPDVVKVHAARLGVLGVDKEQSPEKTKKALDDLLNALKQAYRILSKNLAVADRELLDQETSHTWDSMADAPIYEEKEAEPSNLWNKLLEEEWGQDGSQTKRGMLLPKITVTDKDDITAIDTAKSGRGLLKTLQRVWPSPKEVASYSREKGSEKENDRLARAVSDAIIAAVSGTPSGQQPRFDKVLLGLRAQVDVVRIVDRLMAAAAHQRLAGEGGFGAWNLQSNKLPGAMKNMYPREDYAVLLFDFVSSILQWSSVSEDGERGKWYQLDTTQGETHEFVKDILGILEESGKLAWEGSGAPTPWPTLPTESRMSRRNREEKKDTSDLANFAVQILLQLVYELQVTSVLSRISGVKGEAAVKPLATARTKTKEIIDKYNPRTGTQAEKDAVVEDIRNVMIESRKEHLEKVLLIGKPSNGGDQGVLGAIVNRVNIESTDSLAVRDALHLAWSMYPYSSENGLVGYGLLGKNVSDFIPYTSLLAEESKSNVKDHIIPAVVARDDKDLRVHRLGNTRPLGSTPNAARRAKSADTTPTNDPAYMIGHELNWFESYTGDCAKLSAEQKDKFAVAAEALSDVIENHLITPALSAAMFGRVGADDINVYKCGDLQKLLWESDPIRLILTIRCKASDELRAAIKNNDVDAALNGQVIIPGSSREIKTLGELLSTRAAVEDLVKILHSVSTKMSSAIQGSTKTTPRNGATVASPPTPA